MGIPGEEAINPSRINGEPFGYPGIGTTSLIAGVPGVGSFLAKKSDGFAPCGNLKAGLAEFCSNTPK